MIKIKDGTKGGGEDKQSAESSKIKEVKKCFSEWRKKFKLHCCRGTMRGSSFFLFLK